MKHNRLMALAAALFAAGAVCLAQTKQEQVIEGGGTGPWKSVAVEEICQRERQDSRAPLCQRRLRQQ